MSDQNPHPERPLPLVVGDRRHRDVAVQALSFEAAKAIGAVLYRHEAEFAAALEPFGIEWRDITMPDWYRFVTIDEAREAIASYDRTGNFDRKNP